MARRRRKRRAQQPAVAKDGTRPMIKRDIDEHRGHIRELIGSDAHDKREHGHDVNWQHLMNRLAAAEVDSRPNDCLAFSKSTNENVFDAVVEETFFIHQDTLVECSELAYNGKTMPEELGQYKRAGGYDNGRIKLTIDTEHPDSKFTDGERGEGIVRDPKTGHIRLMSSSLHSIVLRPNSRRAMLNMTEDSQNAEFPYYTLVSVFCDLREQVSVNNYDALSAAASEHISENVNLIELARNAQGVTQAHNAKLMCSVDESFRSNIQYQAKTKPGTWFVERETMSVPVNDDYALRIRFDYKLLEPTEISIDMVPSSTTSGLDQYPIRDMADLYGMLNATNNRETVSDVLQLFSRLEECGAVTAEFVEKFGIGSKMSLARSKFSAAYHAHEQATDDVDYDIDAKAHRPMSKKKEKDRQLD